MMMMSITKLLKYHNYELLRLLTWPSLNQQERSNYWPIWWLKDKGSRESKSFIDLALFKDEPLPDDFKLPNFIKFDGTWDPRLHLRQYANFMAATKLT